MNSQYKQCSFITVVYVMFVNDTYCFEEGEMGMIQVKISNHIAMNLEVLINGGEGNLCIHECTGMCVCVFWIIRECVDKQRQRD